MLVISTRELTQNQNELQAKIDRGIKEYRNGKAKKLAASDINSFLGICEHTNYFIRPILK